MTSKFYMVRRGVVGSLTELSVPFEGETAAVLSRAGWEAAVPGPLVPRAYVCRVNGDGFKFKSQAMLDGAGKTIDLIDRFDLGTEEI